MAITVSEQQVSREVDRTDGRVTGKIMLSVYEAAGSTLTPTQAIIAAHGTYPLGTPFPGEPTLQYLGNYRTIRVEGHTDLCQIELTFRNIDVQIGDPQPSEIGYIEFGINYTAEFINVWRKPPVSLQQGPLFVPADGTVNDDWLFGNIGGAGVDIAGEPVPQLRRTSILTITEVVSGLPPFVVFGENVGNRNEVVFAGAAKGKLVYVGTQLSRIDVSKFNLQHEIHYDKYFHLQQIPFRLPNGEIELSKFLDPKTDLTVTRASKVFWRQPYTDFFDMNQLSPTGFAKV